jgi:tetratricopeptide (TPR) repeat protein
MPQDDGAQLDVRAQDEVTRPDLRVGSELEEQAAEGADASGFRALTSLLEVELAAAESRERQAEIAWALGRLLSERRGDPRGALAAWRTAFERDSGFIPNLWSLRGEALAQGDWIAALETLEAELRAQPQPEARAELHLAMGRIYEEQLCNPQAARRGYLAALELVPGHRTATAFLVALAEQRRDPEQLAAAYERAVQSSGDRAERSLFLEASARLSEDRGRLSEQRSGDDPVLAMQLAALAVREDPTNVAARRALKRLYHAHGRWAELCEVLLTEADLAASDPDRSLAYYLAGRVLGERLGQRDRALDIYRRALSIAPDDPLVLGEVARTCQALGRWEEALAVVERLARSGSDRRMRAALHLQAGRLAAERRGDDDRAGVHYLRAVELDPRCEPALARLDELYARRGDWEELSRLLVSEADLATEPAARAARLHRAGQIALDRLGEAERAAELMARALAADPDFLPARAALERLLRALGRFQELAELYSAELGRTTEVERRAELLEALAEVHGSHTGELERAAVELAELRQLAVPTAGARVTRSMLSVLERSGRWRELAEALAELAGGARQGRQAASLWHQSGEIWEGQVGELDEAARCHREALRVAPDFVPALEALARICADRGRLEELVAVTRRHIELTQVTSTRAALHYRLAELWEAQPGGEEAAIEAYHAALGAVPGHAPSLLALERLHAAGGDHARLVEVLERAADCALDAADKATLHFRAGQVVEDQLGDPAGAADVYARAIALVADHAPSLEALDRLYAGAERWTELCDVRRRLALAAVDDAARVAAWIALGEVLWERLGDVEGAIQAWRRALVIDPHDAAALRRLERLLLQTGRAAAGPMPPGPTVEAFAVDFGSDPVRQPEVARDPPTPMAGERKRTLALASPELDLVEVYERLAGRADEPEAQVALWRRAAAVREAQGGGRDASFLYERVREAAPHDRGALEALDRLYSARGQVPALLPVLEALADLAPDGRTRVALALRVASAQETAGNLDDAIAGCERAVEADPGCVAAVRELRRLRELLGDAGGLLHALEREAHACRDPRSRVRALSHAATIALARFRDEERAAACLRRAVEIDPADAEVGTRLEQLYGRLGQWERMVELLERRAAASDQDRVAVLLRLMEVERDHLDRPAAAVEVLRRVVALQPSHVSSLVALGDLHVQLESASEAAAAYGRAAVVADDPPVLRSIYLKLGDLWDRRLSDPRRAIACFQNVLATSSSNIVVTEALPADAVAAQATALERMAQIFVAGRDWPSAAAALTRLVELEPEPARAVEHELRLADVYASGYGDPQAALAAFGRALERDPTSDAAARGLEDACARAGDYAPLARALEASAQALSGPFAAARAQRRLQAADLQLDQLGSPEEAARLYREVLAEDPDHVEARARLAGVLGRRLGQADEAIREHQRVLGTDPVRADAYRELRRLYERAGNGERALWAAQSLRALRVADEQEERYIKERRVRTHKLPQGTIPPALAERALLHPGEQHPGRPLLLALGEVLPRLHPASLEDWGVQRSDRVGQKDDPLRALVDEVARALGVSVEFELYVSRTRPKEIDIEGGEPPVLIVGAGLAAAFPAAEQRFLLGRALTRLAARSHVVRRLSAVELEALVVAAVRTVVPQYGSPVAPDEVLGDLSRRIARMLPRRSRRQFEDAAEAYAAARAPRFDVWLRAVEHTANRGGLLVADDLSASLDVLRRGDRRSLAARTPEELAVALRANGDVVELLRFALTDDFFTLRRALELAIP